MPYSSWKHYKECQNFDYSTSDYNQAKSEITMWSILKRYDGQNAEQIQKEILALDWPYYPNRFSLSGDIEDIEDDIDCLFTPYEDDDCMWDERKAAREEFWVLHMEAAA